MAKKKKVEETPVIEENIETEYLESVMEDRFGDYAKYVIQDRAIPDARDGLKPVQRRIIYSMFQHGNTFDKPTKKCATIVGAVMGKLHPHGDTSIYDALVRMSQPWKTNMPIIKFQGNNGSIDNDPAAAYRYTEAKLNELAMELVRDLDKDTVDRTWNFDDTEKEPIVLPSRFPNLFVNGSSGIAVAVATEIPPHNLKEVIDATIYRMDHPHSTVEDLMQFVKGPDFPTGGVIYKSQGIKDIYETGRGSIELASKVDIVEEKDANYLIITQIPYQVNKQELVSTIDKIRKNKDIDGIIEVIDESADEDIKISISLKKEVDPNIVLTYLLKKTQLKVNYNANIVAISNNKPKVLTLTDYLDTYIAHQVDVITRRSNHDIIVAKKRLHIVEGLIKAISIIKEVVETIQASKNKEDAKVNLINKFGFSEEQAEAIVMMRLYVLSNQDITKYINEKDELTATIASLEEILNDNHKLMSVIKKDLREISKKYGVDRRSTIIDRDEIETEINKRDLIIKEDTYVVITKDGYVKRSTFRSHDASNGSMPGLKVGDVIVFETIANTGDYILAFTNKGNYLYIPVHEIQEVKWKDEGKHINYLINLPIDELIVRCILVKDFEKDVSIGLVSKCGQIKKTKLADFKCTRYSRPITCMRLLRDDELVDVSVLNGNSNLFILTETGNATYFNENEVSCSGLKTSGVKSISTVKKGNVISLLSYRDDQKGKVIIVTDAGMYRIFNSANLVLTGRLGKVQTVFKSFKSDPHVAVYANKIVTKNEPLIIHALMSDNSTLDFTIDDLSLTPMDKMCRKNLTFPSKLTIESISSDSVQVIDENTPVVVVEKSTTEETSSEDSNNDEETEERGYQQISIFDDMGD